MKRLLTLGLSLIFAVNVFAVEGESRNFVIGASLQNKGDNSVLELRCLEANEQRDCLRMQYYLRMAEIADPIGPELSAKDFIMTPAEIEVEIDKVANRSADKKRFEPFYLSDNLFEPDDKSIAYPLYVLAAGGTVVAVVFASIYAPATLFFCAMGMFLTGAPTLDMILLPFKSGYVGIHNLGEKIKARKFNRKEEQKIRKTYKKLFKMVTGNPKLIKVGEKQFNQIIDTIESI